jgi:sugar phosphate isomerase/epimerase
LSPSHFARSHPRAVADLARRCGLSGIEWGGDVHAPHGDLEAAQQVLAHTRAANLEVAAYGSYYRAGELEEGARWEQVLASAQVLEAPLIRVWAGKRGSQEADGKYFQAVTDDLKRICESTEKIIALEFHGGTLCDSGDAARQVLEAVNRPNLRSLWQPANGQSIERRLEDLRTVKPWLANLHVFHWDAQGFNGKRDLEAGRDEWSKYLREAQSDENLWALLEFVRGDEPEQLERDAKTLQSWLQQNEI